MRTAYDSTNPFDIPTSAAIVAGYIDGIYAWPAAGWARFPNAVHVRIACFATTDDGEVLDVETGDATPGQAPHWVLMRRAAGVDPTVYANRSNWGATRQAFAQQGVAEPHYWLAAYDGIAEIPAGTVAKQYANSAIAGGHYDLSSVANVWPGVDNTTTGGTMTPLQEAWVIKTLEQLAAELLQGAEGDGVRMKFSTLGAAVLDIQARVKDLEAKASQPTAASPLNITLTGTAKP